MTNAGDDFGAGRHHIQHHRLLRQCQQLGHDQRQRPRSILPTHHRWRDHRQRSNSRHLPAASCRQREPSSTRPDCGPVTGPTFTGGISNSGTSGSPDTGLHVQRQHDLHRRHCQHHGTISAAFGIRVSTVTGSTLQRRHQQFRHVRFAGLGGHSRQKCRFVRHHQFEGGITNSGKISGGQSGIQVPRSARSRAASSIRAPSRSLMTASSSPPFQSLTALSAIPERSRQRPRFNIGNNFTSTARSA